MNTRGSYFPYLLNEFKSIYQQTTYQNRKALGHFFQNCKPRTKTKENTSILSWNVDVIKFDNFLLKVHPL